MDFLCLFDCFLEEKNLTEGACVDRTVDAFMRKFEIPVDFMEPLRGALLEAALEIRRRQGTNPNRQLL